MPGPLLSWDVVKGSPGHAEGEKSGLHRGFVGGWWRKEFALLRAAPAAAGFGILKQPRQTRSLVTNRADTVKQQTEQHLEARVAVTEPLRIPLPAQTVRKTPHNHCPGAQSSAEAPHVGMGGCRSTEAQQH